MSMMTVNCTFGSLWCSHFNAFMLTRHQAEAQQTRHSTDVLVSAFASVGTQFSLFVQNSRFIAHDSVVILLSRRVA